jgi:ribonucleoside-diphosphate reductase alpha chain
VSAAFNGVRLATTRVRLERPAPSVTWKFRIVGESGSQSGYFTVGHYPDGSPGEVFLIVNRVGTTLRAMMDAWAVRVSYELQHGIPLGSIVDSARHTRFEPAGGVEMDAPPLRIGRCTSVLDLVARIMGATYLGRTDFCDPEPLTPPPVVAAPVPAVLSVEPSPAELEVMGEEYRQWAGDRHRDEALVYRARADTARSSGYEGEPCLVCQAFKLRRSGACLTCEACGANTGCG